jgi:hypothetical protein
MGFLDENSEPISNDIIESYGIPTMSYQKYQKLASKYEEPPRAILNLNWKDGGTHWVGVKTSPEGTIHYYDPFGVSPPFSKNFNRVVVYNPIKDQEMNQSNCGWRSLFFVLNGK